MNNPIPLDLAKRVRAAYIDAPLDTTAHEDMQAALATHLPEIAACHYREVDAGVINRALHDDSGCEEPWPCCAVSTTEHDRDRAHRIAAALSDATNGGHWEEGDEAYDRAAKAGLPRREERVGIFPNATRTTYGWVPADPDAALLAIVSPALLARLREVAEVTAR